MTMYERWKPAISKRGLFVLGGALWGSAGTVLLVRGYFFLPDTTGDHIVLGNLGVFLGILFLRFFFTPLTDKAISRIQALQIDRPCLFSFQSWRSYGIMSLMISTGILVRQTGVVSLPALGTTYIAMGTPLMISSVRLLLNGVRHQ